jgi:tRNA A-37 threonylcarbamoyl transferase component Bud32
MDFPNMLRPSRRHLEVIIRDSEGHQLSRCLIRRGRYISARKKERDRHRRTFRLGPHARLTVASDDELFIEDMESANGTFVDGFPAAEMTPVTFSSEIMVGNTRLEFHRSGLPASVFEQLPEGFLRESRYDFGEAVVEGSTSTIFTARDTSLGRSIAIKIMRKESQANAAHVLRFVREAQITSTLQHPGILPIYELNLGEESQLYYTTRFVEGESLASLLERLAAGDPETLSEWSLAGLISAFQKICDTIAFAHSRGVVHGNLQPASITVGSFGEVFVTNWVHARVFTSETSEESIRSRSSRRQLRRRRRFRTPRRPNKLRGSTKKSVRGRMSMASAPYFTGSSCCGSRSLPRARPSC